MNGRIIADLDNLKALADFAYEQGFHEMGYDPVAAVANEIERLEAELADAKAERADAQESAR